MNEQRRDHLNRCFNAGVRLARAWRAMWSADETVRNILFFARECIDDQDDRAKFLEGAIEEARYPSKPCAGEFDPPAAERP